MDQPTTMDDITPCVTAFEVVGVMHKAAHYLTLVMGIHVDGEWVEAVSIGTMN